MSTPTTPRQEGPSPGQAGSSFALITAIWATAAVASLLACVNPRGISIDKLVQQDPEAAAAALSVVMTLGALIGAVAGSGGTKPGRGAMLGAAAGAVVALAALLISNSPAGLAGQGVAVVVPLAVAIALRVRAY
ncbi:hypothetical protein Pla175_45180 [Pirellulimonas nuda]|uniref:TIGR04086 family membrane protein n=1 Tax=Pirellulimonas nuda TaxID=2528009 RepID=A0A518DHZ0_9BACT|nr:hypothetical protein [Pirellulimonas nuda]QDU91100.1 hypothetical protein Pla175_45180 [Pirellulimonas nuda]